MQGAGGVGRDELEVDGVAALRVVRAEGGTGLDDDLGQRAGGRSIQPDVDEPGPGDLHARDALDGCAPFGDLGGELARVAAAGLGELEGGVGGPVDRKGVVAGSDVSVRVSLEGD